MGFEQGGQLTEAVRRKPYCVLLLDEVEKAHPDVFNALLQLMDDGRLTDGQGRTVNFRNTLLLMTSNLPQGELKSRFRPEFLNRIDEILTFHDLNMNHLRKIVEIQLEAVRRRLSERRVALALEPSAKDFLAREGHNPTYGARPLKRAIQKHLVDPLARLLLTGEAKEGDTLAVSAGKEGLSFKAAKKQPDKTTAQ